MDYDMKAVFTSAASDIMGESRLINNLWQQIEKAYNNETRFYHTMKHLQHMYAELLFVKQNIKDWDCVLFTLFYHDIVYEPTRNNNEMKSAELAKEHLESLQLPYMKIEKCMNMILATKDHAVSDDNDINYFTDADLSILGSNRSVYIEYYKNIRKEYSVLPDSIYKSGRKMVLQHFINMPAIFKTKHFFDKYEKQARKNLKYELGML